MTQTISAALAGFATSLALILAIGAQNAFVLRQGLMRAHVGPLVLFCAASDAILITVGVAGFGWIVMQAPWLPTAMALAGAGFLIVYGGLRVRAAWQAGYAPEIAGQSGGLWATLATAAAFTWANPHVYLDTLGLIGAVSTGYPAGPQKWAFGIGAVAASFTFFTALGFGARLLAPVMTSARAWRILDIGVAAMMWAIAAGLLAEVI